MYRTFVKAGTENGSLQGEGIENFPGTRNLVKTFEEMNVQERQRRVVAASHSRQKLNVLVVFAHEEKDSLTASITRATRDALEAQGHNVTVSDLYAMNFNPVLSRADVKGEIKKAGKFNLQAAVKQAYEDGMLSDDIVTEQDKLRRADLVIFQFPMHWGGLPAMEQGWLDRVLVPGFAFRFETGQVFDRGMMKGKKAMLSVTLGGAETAFTNRGMMGDINAFLWQIQNTALRFCGFDVLPPHLVYGTMLGLSAEQGDAILDLWKTRLASIHTESPITFVPMHHFEPRSMSMKDEVVNRLSDGTNGPMRGFNLGQNLGQAFPPDSMVKGGLGHSLH